MRLAETVVADLLAYEAREGKRRRRRKPDADTAMRRAIYVIVANLAHVVLFLSGEGDETALILPVAHPRGQQAERPREGFGKGLPALLEGLHALGLIILHKPEQYRLATTIAPATGFRLRLLEGDVSPNDIGREMDPNRLLRLSQRVGGQRTYFAIPDTAEASQHGQDMARLNMHLAGARIAYLGNDPVDVGDRLMVRRFNLPLGIDRACLDYGGRLCGGFWQNMKRENRAHIRIDGEDVVELDYGQMFLRLAYGSVGARPPEGIDLYAIPGLGEHRDGVKQGVNALLWDAKRWGPEIVASLPPGWPASKLRSVLADHHPSIAHLFQSGRMTGYRLLHRESAVMVAVLLACMAVGVVALPIHDAVLVPVSAADAVAGIMQQSALTVAGVAIPVHLKA